MVGLEQVGRFGLVMTITQTLEKYCIYSQVVATWYPCGICDCVSMNASPESACDCACNLNVCRTPAIKGLFILNIFF